MNLFQTNILYADEIHKNITPLWGFMVWSIHGNMNIFLYFNLYNLLTEETLSFTVNTLFPSLYYVLSHCLGLCKHGYQ